MIDISKLQIPEQITHDFVKQLLAIIQAQAEEITYSKARINVLEEHLKSANQHRFGKHTESNHQLSLFPLDEDSDNSSSDDTSDVKGHKRNKNKRGRTVDLDSLPTVVRTHDLSDEDKQCTCCQKPMNEIGYSSSKKLDIVPARLQVIEHRTLKYACGDCQEIQQAKMPEMPLGKMLATPALVVDTILKKFANSMPYYRIAQDYQRYGVNLEDNTIANWVIGAAKLLVLLADAFKAEIAHVKAIQMDETPYKILGQKSKAYIWTVHSYQPGQQFVWYQFASSRSGKNAQELLTGFSGILHTDGYSGYEQLRNMENIIPAGCWTHARRYYVDVIKASGVGKGISTKIVACIAKLFIIDKAFANGDYPAEYTRLMARQKDVPKVIDEIKQLRDQTIASGYKQGKIWQATQYLSNQWDLLQAFLTNGDIELSTSWVENDMRPIAIGRKNWLFVKSLDTGKASGLMFSIIQSCKLNQLNPRLYLLYVISQIPAMRRGQINPATLLPHRLDRSILDNLPQN